MTITEKLLELEIEMQMPFFTMPERKVIKQAGAIEKQIKGRKPQSISTDEWLAIPERMRALILVAFLRAVQDHAKKLLS